MTITANVTSGARLRFSSAPKLATKQRVALISKPVVASSTTSASSQAGCEPVSHHKIKGALSN
jgi:hypothetical protein